MCADDTSLTFASADVNRVNNCLDYDLQSKVYTWLSAKPLVGTLIGFYAEENWFGGYILGFRLFWFTFQLQTTIGVTGWG